MITAEQVKDAWCGNLKRDCLYDPPAPDWQAIADELNATLGAGTCKVVASEPDGQMWVYRHEFSCDCGQRNYFTASSEPPKYCPNCGKRVEQ